MARFVVTFECFPPLESPRLTGSVLIPKGSGLFLNTSPVRLAFFFFSPISIFAGTLLYVFCFVFVPMIAVAIMIVCTSFFLSLSSFFSRMAFPHDSQRVPKPSSFFPFSLKLSSENRSPLTRSFLPPTHFSLNRPVGPKRTLAFGFKFLNQPSQEN